MKNTVRRMSGNIFAGCTSLTSITLPSSLERITGSTFKNTRLVNVVMPVSTTNIGIYVFNDIPTLQSITIYDNVTTIHENAFNNTSNLTFRVLANSYALQYAQNHNINYEIIT